MSPRFPTFCVFAHGGNFDFRRIIAILENPPKSSFSRHAGGEGETWRGAIVDLLSGATWRGARLDRRCRCLRRAHTKSFSDRRSGSAGYVPGHQGFLSGVSIIWIVAYLELLLPLRLSW